MFSWKKYPTPKAESAAVAVAVVVFVVIVYQKIFVVEMKTKLIVTVAYLPTTMTKRIYDLNAHKYSSSRPSMMISVTKSVTS
jgi:hypothetical protein